MLSEVLYMGNLARFVIEIRSVILVVKDEKVVGQAMCRSAVEMQCYLT